MAERIYLAMTAAEFASEAALSPRMAWMACHFSPYGTGLSNLPPSLPAGSLLILNDRIPIGGHDPGRIAEQLALVCEANRCGGILLDFQRADCPETRALAQKLSGGVLPCAVAVSEMYGKDLSCPVFLPPCPHHVPLKEYIAPRRGRELWLDLAFDCETITLTEDGASILPLPLGELPEGGYREETLHCHYRVETSADTARFTLWRTTDDLNALAEEAEGLGIKMLVGLYQELK